MGVHIDPAILAKMREEGRLIEGPRKQYVLPEAKMSEEEFQRNVINLAHSLGWTVMHCRRARTTKGWRTAWAADGTGYPDLVLYRDRIIHVEVKSESGKMGPDQENWRDRIQAAGGEWYLWRPADLADIRRILE